MPPEALVDLLNNVFSEIDDLTEKYDLEKIKTIGDAYMVWRELRNAAPTGIDEGSASRHGRAQRERELPIELATSQPLAGSSAPSPSPPRNWT